MPVPRRGRFRYLVVLAVLTVVLYTLFMGGGGGGHERQVSDKSDFQHPTYESEERPAAPVQKPDYSRPHPDEVHHAMSKSTKAPPSRTEPASHNDLPSDPSKNPDQMANYNEISFPVGRKENFPVKKVQPIPTDIGRIPRIQATPPVETKTQRIERLKRRDVVKATMKRDWAGYANYAWGHDEFKPVSNGSKDPFGGWGATLVDPLDTLLIMGLIEEYETALKAVRKIDFTYTSGQIPVFETTIRYLGGLLGAYDMATTLDRHDTVLLEQAKSIGEVLFGAFDTPNRMPMLWFDYKLQTVEGRNMRAPQSGCMAELGSLSLEFTRLAQITGEAKYFDAVQRITDALEEALPYMSIEDLWPTDLDLSGCRLENDKCEEQGLRPVPWDEREAYSFGGKADSTYEYFTKQYLLLGGGKVAQQYKRLYEATSEAGRKWLVFQPLVPGDLGKDKIRMLGHVDVFASQPAIFYPIMEHLTCFVGGMYGMAAKAFGIDSHLDLAVELTEGCVWSYGITKTGVMPDTFKVRECVVEQDQCSWDQLVEQWKAGKIEQASGMQYVKDSDIPKHPAFNYASKDGQSKTAGRKLERRQQQNKAAELTKVAFEEAEIISGGGGGGGLGKSQEPDFKATTPHPIQQAIGPDYQLRPEAIESVWYMYRITGDRHWQEVGWQMWLSVEFSTRTDSGHAQLVDVDADKPLLEDRCQSFWYAETLKYFYLLFDDFDAVSLDRFVLNTEAHPLLRADQTVKPKKTST